MTVLVTGKITDATGREDSRRWRAYSPVYREGSNGEVVNIRPQSVRVVAGHFTAELEPGIVVIENPEGTRYTVTVPNENANLWELIATAVAFPPDTSAEALASAVTTFLEENPVTSVISEGITDSGAAGRAAVQADTAAELREAAGASATGEAVLTGDAAAGRTALGAVSMDDLGPALVIAEGAGVDATGSADSATALQAILTAAADGSTVHVPAGTYRVDSTLTVADKSLTVDATAARFTKSNAGPVFGFSATVDALHDVASVTPTTITEETTLPGLVIAFSNGSLATGWVRGDIIKLISDDVIPGGRNGASSMERRCGQYLTVESVDAGEVTVYGSLYDPMATNIRAARMKSEHKVRLLGGSYDAYGGTQGVIRCTNLVDPEVLNPNITTSQGTGVLLYGCFGYEVSPEIHYAPNNPGSSLWGYGVLDVAGAFGSARIQMLRGRHAFTTDTPESAADTAEIWCHGRTYGTNVSGVGVDVASTAWSTHPESAEIVFDNIVGHRCFALVGLRGRRHKVRGANGRDLNRLIWVFTHTANGADSDSWGHDIDGVVGENITSDSVGAILFDINPTSGTRETRATRLRNITINGHAFSAVHAINATVEVESVKAVAAATMTDYCGLLYPINSVIRGAGVKADYYANTTGTGLVFATIGDDSEIHLGGENEWLFSSGQTSRMILLRRNDATEVVRISGLQLDALPSNTISGTSPAGQLYSADSYLDWSIRSTSSALVGTSSDVYAVNAEVADTVKLSQIANTRAKVVTLVVNLSTDQTLGELPAGRLLGQQLNIVRTNGGGSYNLTVPNTPAKRVRTAQFAGFLLGNSKSTTLIWDGSYWSQSVPPIATTAAIQLGSVELGHATDTTITRVSAGRIAVEGATVAHMLTGTATLDFGSVAAQSHVDLTITVTGAATGDAVSLGVPTAAVTAGIAFTAWVSATNTVTVRAHNYTAGALDPASGSFKAMILR